MTPWSPSPRRTGPRSVTSGRSSSSATADRGIHETTVDPGLYLGQDPFPMRTLARSFPSLSSTALLATTLASGSLLGCGGDGSGVSSIYVVTSSLSELSGEKFFDQPWPN